MGKSLIITEKPSVAREFAQVLGVSGRQDGYLENENYVITWCVGHLVEMVYPEVYDEKYKKWKLEDLPFLPRDYKYDVIPAVSKQYDIVHGMLHREDIDTVYWAGDAGKEGQTIEENIRNFGGVREGMTELRVWIDSQTEEEIRRGIREAKPMSEYANLGKSGIMRTIEDYAMGINFSRAMSVKYGRLLNDAAGTNSYTAIAVGRVMTCVLGMVVIREREIRNFKETPFYRVVGNFSPAGMQEEAGVAQAEWKAVEGSKYFESPYLYKENGFKEESTAKQLISELTGRKAIVNSIEQGISKKKAPLLFNLAELQAECSKRFKISPDETLQVAQDLYEKKLTTYPRTDARVLSTAVAKEIGKNISRLKGYEPTTAYVEKIMKEGLHYNIAKTAYVDDSKVTDHYAIIPTGQLTELGSLNSLQRAVFDLIVRRFLSIFYPAAEYQTVKLTVEISHPGANSDYMEKLFASTKVLKSPGYLEIAGYKKNVEENSEETDESEKDENRGLLALAQRIKNGDELSVHGFEIKEGKTSPPKRYTSGSMVLAMENAGQLIEDEELRAQIKGSGIGTSATRAEIIKKLVRIGYLNLNKKSQVLSPETMGEMVYEVVNMTVPALLNPKMTASWEKGLDGITRGTVIMEDYREKLEEFIRKETLAMIEQDRKLQLITQIQPLTGKGARGAAAKKKLGVACPICGGELETTPFGYGCSNYKKDGTGCKFSMGTVAGRDLSEEEFKALITNGRTEVMNGFVSKNKKKFSGALVLQKDEEGKVSINFDFSENKPEIIEDVKCPACGNAIVKTPFGYACEHRNRNVEGSCTFAIGKMAEKDLNPAQVKELLTNGITSTIRGFKGKSGKKFDACVVLEKDETGKYTTKFDFEHVEMKKVKDAFCPKCGGEILVVSFGYVCANRNPNTPDGCDFSIGKIADKDLNEAQVKELLENGRTSTIRGFKSKSGKKFDACITFDKAEDGTIKGLKFDFENVEAKKVKDVRCPICKGDIVQTPFGFGCANYSKDNPESCRFSIGKMADKALNEMQVKELLTFGRTSTIRGFKSKEGKKFDARVALNKDETGKVIGLKFDFTDLEAPKVKDVKCPLCGGDIVQTPFGFGCANYSKDNPDSCRFSIGKISGVKLKEAQVKELLLNKKTEVIKGFVAKTGMMFDAPLKLTEDGQIAFDFPEKSKAVETTVSCPKCKKMMQKSQWYYECECGFKVSHTVAKVELSEEIIKELFETGKTKDKVIGFTSKSGNVFDACLKFEDDRISFDFDNPGSANDGGNKPFYEELESNPVVLEQQDATMNREEAQYISDDVPAFYDAMADEIAAYQEQEMQEQILGDAFLAEENS